MKRKILSLILVFAMTVSLFTVGAGAAEPIYRDTDGHWAAETIEGFSRLGLIEGYNGQFFPNKNITRGEMAVILDRLMDYQTAAKNSFSDLGEAFYTDAVLKANAVGVMLGSNGTVRPTDPITRQEAAVLLCRALGLEGGGSVAQFSDRGQIASWAADAVGVMAAKKLLQGANGMFRPTEAITRAETVAILDRALGKLVSAGESASGRVDGDVVIRGAGAKLSDMTINGDLIIAEGVGEGEVHLDGVTITGRTIVRGGGVNSIYMNNVRANGGVVVNKLDGRVRVVTSGNTTVSVTLLQSGAILVGDGFKTVEIPADIAKGQTVEIQGNIERLVNSSENVEITANGTIQTVEANVKTEIKGDAKVVGATGSADVKVNGSTVAKTDKPAAGGSTGGSTGGSSSGGSTGGSTGDSSSGGSTNAYTIAFDTTACEVKVNESKQLSVTITPALTNAAVSYLSSDTSVATVAGSGFSATVKGIAAGTATVTAKATIGGTEYSGSRTVTVKADTPVEPGKPTEPSKPGWGGAETVDARFAAGYPLCSTENGKIVIKVKVPSATEQNPVEAYMVVNQRNGHRNADVDAVLHGHSGENFILQADAAPYLRLTDGEEHTIQTNVRVDGTRDIKVHFVLKDSGKTSETVTTVKYTGAVVQEVDKSAPWPLSAYINKALDAVYVYLDGNVDVNSVPASSAFTLSGVDGASVNVKKVEIHEAEANRQYYVKLDVYGINKDTDISKMTVTYTKPETNPIQDTATTPNVTEGFTRSVQKATISLEAQNVHISADGKYLSFKTKNCEYFYDNAADDSFDVEVTSNGQTLNYQEADISWTNGGGPSEYWLKLADNTAAPQTGDQVTVTLKPQTNVKDFAMDKHEEVLNATVTVPDEAAALKIASAVYDATNEKLTVTFSGSKSSSLPAACCFQLVNGGQVYGLRGNPTKDRWGGVVFSAENMPVLPSSGWQLRYEVQHENAKAHQIITELSGKPMETQIVTIQ